MPSHPFSAAKVLVRHAVIACLVSSPVAALAQQPTESLSRCLADNTTGKDRKDLARWIFFAMAAHPEIKRFTAPDIAPAADDSNRAMAAAFTRLLADTCAPQTKAAIGQSGPVAIEEAFGTLGQLAMQELMSDRAVNASMAAYAKYIDQEKLAKVLSGK